MTTNWTPPTYSVDENGKVVGGYTPPGANNWGRWGDDDQRGAANLITGAEVRHAATLVRRGAVFSLALPINAEAPRYPARPAAKHGFVRTGSDAVSASLCGTPLDGLAYNDDEIDMYTHGSTHWDALSHIQVEDTLYNGYWAGAVSATSGAEVLAIGNMRSSFVGRGILLDAARHAGVETLEPGTVIGRDDLDAICAAQGVEVRRGDIVLLRTGYLTRWWTLTTDAERADYFIAGSPGAGVSAIPWFVEHEVAAVAADTIGLEVLPSEDEYCALHKRMLVDLGMSIGEFFDLDELAADCASDGVYEFLLVAPPLYLPRAVGSPLNPIAIK